MIAIEVASPFLIPLKLTFFAALILAMAYEIVAAGRQDHAFLARCCSGAEAFLAYLTGASDGMIPCSFK